MNPIIICYQFNFYGLKPRSIAKFIQISFNESVQFISRSLILLFALVFLFYSAKVSAWEISDPPVSYGTFGTNVDNYGQLAVHPNGNVFVSGAFGSGSIEQLDEDGNSIRFFGPLQASGVAVDLDGNILVPDWNSQVGVDPGVYKFDVDGNPIDISGTDLGGTAYFQFAYSVAVDSQGNVYVSDWQGNGDADPIYKFDVNGDYVATIVGNGTSFDQISSVAVDGDDNLYVLDANNNRVQKFDSDGNFVLEITGNGGDWSFPEGFTVDSDGNIYVSDSGNERIQIFNAAGVFQQELDADDFGLVSFSYISGLYITEEGKLFVADSDKILTAQFDRSPAEIVPPSIPGDTTDDTTPILTGTVTDDSVITLVEISIDGGDYEACNADDGAFDEITEEYTCTVTTPLTEGEHTVEIRATDDLGHINEGETIASYTFTVGASAPDDDEEDDDNSSSSRNSSSRSSSAFVCRDEAPNSAPDLFQIDVNNDSAKLFFTPISNTDKYFISFSTNQSAEEHGEEVSLAKEGVQSHSVYFLTPNKSYFFKVRGQKGCMPGQWSNVMEVKTGSQGFKNTLNYYKDMLIKTTLVYTNKAINTGSYVKETSEKMSESSMDISPTAVPTVTPTRMVEQPVASQTPTELPEENKFCFLWWCF